MRRKTWNCITELYWYTKQIQVDPSKVLFYTYNIPSYSINISKLETQSR